jgi:zinc protease
VPLSAFRKTLPNGLTLIIQENSTIPAVSILTGVLAGGYEDEAGREGRAALTARTLDRGTATRTADEIADDLDGRGASVSVGAGRHTTTVVATCLSEDFDPVLSLVADLLQAPSFPDPDVATRRGEIITAIREDDDDPAAVSVNRLMEVLYAGHPYARRVRGTMRSVETLQRDDLVAFHQGYFGPGSSVVVIVGDVEARRAADAIAARFESWKAPAPRPPLTAPDAPQASTRRMVTVPMPDKAQADVAYGLTGIRRSDESYLAAWVMNNALGQYALGGRLGNSIRERQGMAYYVYSSLDAGLGPGPVMVRAGVSAANIERTIASIDKELSAVLAEGFTDKEIAESKQYLVGSLPRQLETNAGIAGFLFNSEIYSLGMDYDARLPGMVAGVTRDDAMAAARRLLDPARATVVAAGPAPPSLP